MAKALVLMFLVLLGGAAFGGEAAPAADNPVIEERMMALAGELRCLVCQNQTIADSNASLAVDLRNEIREKMQQGMSDRGIIDFMVARYGDFVLYRPPFKAATLLLWLGPLLLLAAGLFALFYRLARRHGAVETELSADQHARAATLLAAGTETKTDKQ